MNWIPQIDADFIDQHHHYPALIDALKKGFGEASIVAPQRHHHDFPNPKASQDTTLLLMPAWQANKSAGVKMVTVSPDNGKYNLPAIQGIYIYLDAKTGEVKALLDAKSLTAKRTAAASALASFYLSNPNATSLLMIGTGALSKELIQAHASVRSIQQAYVWGRNYEKAKQVATELANLNFEITPIKSITERISEVDIISCATLSPTPLVLGKYLKQGQHLDLVGSYRVDTREADDEVIQKSTVFVDTYEGGLKESGDIVIPIQNGILTKEEIPADLFGLCGGKHSGRQSKEEITLFKSVGHALEDLIAADYYYKQFKNA